MNKKDALFELIKSMTKTEKRYFKIWTMRNGSKEDRYIKLFNAIEKQKEYHEHKMLSSGKLDKAVMQNFRFNKHYLYNLILRSLNSFHASSSVDAELKVMLHSIEILFEKGLFEQCDKLILKGKKICEKYENHICHLNFLKWEIDLMRSRSHEGLTKTAIKKVYKEAAEVTKRHQRINQFGLTAVLISIQEQKMGVVRTNKDRKAIHHHENELLHSLTGLDEKQLSSSEKEMMYGNMYRLAYSMENFKTAYTYIRKQVSIMEASAHQIKETPIHYISALNNIVITKRRLGQFDVDDTIEKFEQIPDTYDIRSPRIKNIVFYRACNLKLDIYAHRGDFEKGLKVINEIIREQKKSHLKIINKEREIILYYNIAVIFFGAGEYSSANLYLNKIIHDAMTDLRSDIYCFARILQLIVHYEMGNQELIEYMVSSTYRFLIKRKNVNLFENAVLKFIKKKTPKINSKQEAIHAFKEFKEELIKITKSPFEKKALDYFDFIAWLDSKIENKKFAEIVKKKCIGA